VVVGVGVLKGVLVAVGVTLLVFVMLGVGVLVGVKVGVGVLDAGITGGSSLGASSAAISYSLEEKLSLGSSYNPFFTKRLNSSLYSIPCLYKTPVK
jgi:hypothetical protein